MHELAIEDDSKTGKVKVVNAGAVIDGAAQSIKSLIADKVTNRKLFYSIELSPVGSADDLNYSELSVRPIFTSITWLSDVNLQFARVAEAPALRWSKQMQNYTAVLSHITCFKLTPDKLSDILANNVKNVFALKGGWHTHRQQYFCVQPNNFFVLFSLQTLNPLISH